MMNSPMTADSTHSIARADPLVLTIAARAGQRMAAAAVDLGAAVILAAAGATLLTQRWALAGGITLTACGIFVIASVGALAVTGRTIGRVVAGTRTVESASGAPAGARLALSLVLGRLCAVDIRGGRDPMSAALAPFELASPRADVALSDRHAPTVTFDSGRCVPLRGALVVGRNPQLRQGGSSAVVGLPDLSRTLASSHLRLEWDGETVWATDLGSDSGTVLHARVGERPLVPYQRIPLPLPVTLAAGDRTLTVTA